MHATYAPHDYAFVLLLARYRSPDPEKVRLALLNATKRAISTAAAVVELSLCAAEEAQGYEEAARYLVSGGLLGNCPRCLLQVAAAPGRVAGCPRCRGPLVAGILPAPSSVHFDPALEDQVRRIVNNRAAETRAQEQVAQAERLRSEGKLAVRPETELAPRDRALPLGPLGHYQLEALIGRGRHTYVYRAKDRRSGRAVALKVLDRHPGEPDSSFQPKLDRLQRESDYSAAVEHPNLVRTGPLEQAGDRFFVAMSLSDGPTLEEVLAARRLGGAALVGQARLTDLRALCTAVCEIAEGLHQAHIRGIVHRDVWARNVFFSKAGHACLGDFGNARRLGGESPFDDAVQTVRVHVPPERIRAERNAQARSDVYSLGILLYEILVGRPPYPETDPKALAQRILAAPPPQPRAANGDVTPEAESVILRAIDPDPVKRFGTAQDFAEALSVAMPAASEDTSASVAESGGEKAVRLVADPVRAVWHRFDYFTHRRGSWIVRAVEAAVAFLLGYGLMAAVAVAPEPDPTEPLNRAFSAYAAMYSSKGFDYDARRQALLQVLGEARRALAEAHPGMQLALARLAWSQGEPAKAERMLTRAMAAPEYRQAARLLHGVIAYGLAERERDPVRVEALRKAAKDDFLVVFSGSRDAYERRIAEGMMRLESGDYEPAQAIFHALSSERPDRPEAFLLEVWTLRKAGKAKDAVATAKAAEGTQPNVPYLGLVGAEALLAGGEVDAARSAAGMLLKRWPDLVEALRIEAAALLARNDASGALERAERALKADPDYDEVQLLRARALALDGRGCEAVEALSLRLEAGSEQGDLLYERGRLYLEHGDRARGEADLKAYREKHPEGPWAARARELLEKR